MGRICVFVECIDVRAAAASLPFFPKERDMPFDSREQRRIMGWFATGVTVVTTKVGEQLWGMTASAFCSLSLDPPLVLVAIEKKATSYEYFSRSDCFAVNILSAAQQDVSKRYAMHGPKDFVGLNIKTAVTGAPILVGSLGYVDCRRVNILAGGDHDIFIGEILAGEANDGEPLLFFRGTYRSISVPESSQ